MDSFNLKNSALTINEGIPQPPSINPGAARMLKKRPGRDWNVADLLQGIREGNIPMLAQAITLVESTLRKTGKSQSPYFACLPFAGNSIRIGITGVPGVGKALLLRHLGNT